MIKNSNTADDIIKRLRKQIRDMKCCDNCKYRKGELNIEYNTFFPYERCNDCTQKFNKWILK